MKLVKVCTQINCVGNGGSASYRVSSNYVNKKKLWWCVCVCSYSIRLILLIYWSHHWEPSPSRNRRRRSRNPCTNMSLLALLTPLYYEQHIEIRVPRSLSYTNIFTFDAKQTKTIACLALCEGVTPPTKWIAHETACHWLIKYCKTFKYNKQRLTVHKHQQDQQPSLTVLVRRTIIWFQATSESLVYFGALFVVFVIDGSIDSLKVQRY